MTQPASRLSYAAATAASIPAKVIPPTAPSSCLHPPCPIEQYGLTLAQKERDNLVFTDLTNEDIILKIEDALDAADCWYELKTYTDANGNEDVEPIPPHVWAVGCHWSGDIWIAASSEDEHNMLIRMIPHWLPRLLD